MRPLLFGFLLHLAAAVACVVAAGCAHSTTDSREGSAVHAAASNEREPFAKGQLILESFDRVRPDSQGIGATARMYEAFPPSAGAKVVEQSADRVVVDYDFAALQATRGLPHDDRPIPARAIFEVVSLNGQSYVHHRMYYTGDESGVAEQWRQSYRDGPVAAMVPRK